MFDDDGGGGGGDGDCDEDDVDEYYRGKTYRTEDAEPEVFAVFNIVCTMAHCRRSDASTARRLAAITVRGKDIGFRCSSWSSSVTDPRTVRAFMAAVR